MVFTSTRFLRRKIRKWEVDGMGERRKHVLNTEEHKGVAVSSEGITVVDFTLYLYFGTFFPR